MRAFVGGILAAFVYFHGPNGDIIAIEPSNGQLVLRPSPPGYAGRTMIETGAGTVVVRESICEVAHALERKCRNDK